MPTPDFDGMPGQPYEYQADAFGSFFKEYDGEGRSQLIVMATGLGKSVTAALIAREVVERRGGRVLVLAHLDNLIGQLAEEFEAWGRPCAIEKADQKALEFAGIGSDSSRCVIGSVQTMKGRRLKLWKPDYFDLIIVDESHIGMDRYKAILDHFPSAKRLGITATPNRADKRSLGEIFTHKCYEYLLPDAIDKGELCNLSVYELDPGAVDLRGLKTKRGEGGVQDYDPRAIADRIGPHIEYLAKTVAPKLGPGQTLIFGPDRHSAQAFASAFRGLGIPCASVDYKTADAREIIRGFKEGTWEQHGEYAALANFGMLTTGFNHKPIGNIINLRPTANLSLLEQIGGRGTRRCKGKVECRFFDFAWVMDGNKLARPVDLFMPPGMDDATRKRARQIVAGADGIDPAEAARQAEAERLAEAEAAEKKRVARENASKARDERKVEIKLKDLAPVKSRSRKPFDLFAVRSMSGLRAPEPTVGTVRMPATDGMKRRLKELGMDNPNDVSQREAEQIVAVWSDRREAGMSSMKQVRFLARQGWETGDAMDLTSREAKQVIDPIFAKFAGRSSARSG